MVCQAVVCSYAIARLALGGRSWAPLLLSAAADAASARCTTVASLASVTGVVEPLVPPEVTATARVVAARVRGLVASALTDQDHREREAEKPAAEYPAPMAVPASVSASASAPAAGLDRDRDRLGDSVVFPVGRGAGTDGVLADALNTTATGAVGALLRLGLWLLAAPPGLSGAEAAEVRRRRTLWLLYLLRPPLFIAVSQPAARGVASRLSGVPLLGALSSYAADFLGYLSKRHFYTSGSQE